MISVAGVSKTFLTAGNAVRSLRDISFAVGADEFLVAIGASGSGKTTLLRSVAGLEWPDAGTIALRGETVFDAANGVDVPPQRRRLGMVFQSYAIWPHLSVIDNVVLPLRYGYQRMRDDAAREAAMRALELVGIGALASRPAPLLSGGQQQRVALARALAVSSDVLLMDEPLSNLDAQLREEVRGELKSLARRVGATVLYVTHDRGEAMGMADRVLVLERGSVLQIGSPADIYDRPASRTMAEFMGRVNWIVGTPSGSECVDTPLGSLRVLGGIGHSGTVAIGVRPESIGVRAAAPGEALQINQVRATAVSVQFLGSHAVLEVEAAGQQLTIETRGAGTPVPGDELVLDLPPDRMFVFAEGAPAAPLAGRRASGMTRGSPFVWIAGVPAAAVLILLLAVVWLSLTNGVPAIPGGPYALNHIRAMLLASETWLVLGNTLVFATIATVIAMVGGTAVAWVVARTDLPGPQFVYAGLTLALLIPGFFPAMGWLFLLGPRIGIVGRVLHQLFGLPQDAITVANAPGMGFVQGLLLVPLAFVLVGPALRTVSGELLEAADVHGLSLFQRVRLVELPVVTPALVAASIYCFMVAVASFDVPGFIGMAYRQFTFSTYVYQLTNPPNGQPQYGPPAAIALVSIVVAILLTLAYQRAIRRGASYQVVTGRGYRPSPYRLGRKRAAVYVGIGLYFVLIFVMPLMLVLWVAVMPYFQVPSIAALKAITLANFVNSPWRLAWAGTSHTLELMVCVPVAAVALGLIASWVIVKSRSRFRGAIDLLLFLPHAVPGIVFAMALLTLALFVISRFLPLAGTVLIIGIAYLLVFVSFAVRSMSVAVVQVSNDLEEAAYVGGLSVGRTMTSVFLPLVSQAALNAWVWIALLVGRELTMAVVLFTPANITLPAVIWSTWFTGELGQSSAMSLVFMVIFLPVVLVYLLQRANRRRPETTALVG